MASENHEEKRASRGKGSYHRLTMASTKVCSRHHDQTVVASATVTSSFIKYCVLMLCLGLWYLARFDRGGIFLASFASFVDLQGLKNILLSIHLGLKGSNLKSKLK